MHQTANSQNVQCDANYKHNIQRILEFLEIFPTHDPTQPNENHKNLYQPNPTQSKGCRRGVVVSGVRRMNEVNARRARLVPGWVTVFGRVYYLGM